MSLLPDGSSQNFWNWTYNHYLSELISSQEPVLKMPAWHHGYSSMNWSQATTFCLWSPPQIMVGCVARTEMSAKTLSLWQKMDLFTIRNTSLNQEEEEEKGDDWFSSSLIWWCGWKNSCTKKCILIWEAKAICHQRGSPLCSRESHIWIYVDYYPSIMKPIALVFRDRRQWKLTEASAA